MDSVIDKKDLVVCYLTSSGIVSNIPCWLYSAVTFSEVFSRKLFIFYNSRDNSGEVLLNLVASQGYQDSMFLNYPIFFSRGLYISFGIHTIHIACEYLPVY